MAGVAAVDEPKRNLPFRTTKEQAATFADCGFPLLLAMDELVQNRRRFMELSYISRGWSGIRQLEQKSMGVHKSRPHATTCWLVSDGGADGGPVPDHTAAPSAILSCGRLLNNVLRATLRHRATKASTEDTNGPHKESVEARSAAI